jgi:hypothetical protein
MHLIPQTYRHPDASERTALRVLGGDELNLRRHRLVQIDGEREIAFVAVAA